MKSQESCSELRQPGGGARDPESIDRRLGAAIKHERQELKLSQVKFVGLLKRMGLTIAATELSRIENGTRALRVSDAMIVAEALGTDIATLLRSGMGEEHVQALGVLLGQAAQAKAKMLEASEVYEGLRGDMAALLESTPETLPEGADVLLRQEYERVRAAAEQTIRTDSNMFLNVMHRLKEDARIVGGAPTDG